jgi:hypothetical protein
LGSSFDRVVDAVITQTWVRVEIGIPLAHDKWLMIPSTNKSYNLMADQIQKSLLELVPQMDQEIQQNWQTNRTARARLRDAAKDWFLTSDGRDILFAKYDGLKDILPVGDESMVDRLLSIYINPQSNQPQVDVVDGQVIPKPLIASVPYEAAQIADMKQRIPGYELDALLEGYVYPTNIWKEIETLEKSGFRESNLNRNPRIEEYQKLFTEQAENGNLTWNSDGKAFVERVKSLANELQIKAIQENGVFLSRSGEALEAQKKYKNSNPYDPEDRRKAKVRVQEFEARTQLPEQEQMDDDEEFSNPDLNG